MDRTPAIKQKIFLLILLLLCSYMLWPFLPSVMLGGVFAILTYPILLSLKRLKLSQWLSALLTSLLTTLLLFVPLSFLVFIGARTAAERLPSLVREMNPQFFQNILHRSDLIKLQNFLRRSFGFDPDRIQDYVFDLTQQVGERAAQLFASFLGHIPLATLYLFVVLISLFYFLHMGPRVRAFWFRHSMFNERMSIQLERKFIAICKSLVLAAFIIGFIQATLFSLVAMILRMENVSVIGLMIFIMSFFPIVGSLPLAIGLALYQLAIGNTAASVILFLTTAVVMGMDNLVRPLILRQGASMNPVVAVVAILGGLNLFGFAGLFLGPLIVGILIESYGLVYGEGASGQ